MEHMKHTHKDPNASGVASKYQEIAQQPPSRPVVYVSLLPRVALCHLPPLAFALPITNPR